MLRKTAGCSGLFGSETGTGTSETPTSADANGPAPGSSGFDAGATNGTLETLSTPRHTPAGRAAIRLACRAEPDGGHQPNRRIDRESDRSLATGELVQASGDTLATTTYTADGTTAERRVLTRGDDRRTDYRSASPPYDGRSARQRERVIDRSLLQSLGSDTTGPTPEPRRLPVQRLAVRSDREQRHGFAADNAVSTNVSANGTTDTASATVLVDEDGVVRSFRPGDAERDGQPVTVTLSLSVSQVDDTTVAEPDWLATRSAGNRRRRLQRLLRR